MPTITGTSGNDFIFGTTGDDLIEGLAGNDTLSGRDGNDEVRGGDGDDTIRGNAGNDILDGGAGDDFIQGDAGNDVIDGGTGNDYLEGGAGIDTIRGGAGDDELSSDFFSPNEAGELYDGGDGSDFLNFTANFSSNAIVFSIASPSADQIVDGVTIRNFEGVNFTASEGNDTLTGAVTGNDVLRGRGGNDLIQGLSGNDLLDGDTGNDDLRGAEGDDVLNGGSGDDSLDGGDGNDYLDGGVGIDQLHGGAGDDSLRIAPVAGGLADGGAGTDFLTLFVGNSNADIVFSLANPAVDQIVEGTTIRNIERADFTASNGNDTLTGGAYADTFLGGFGNDVIHGGGGNDVLKGELGADQLFGDDGDDALTYGSGDTLVDGGAGIDLANFDLLNGSTAVTLDVSDPSIDQNVAGTIVRGIEQLHYTGGDAVNQITGGIYDDFIEGGAANDVLNGGGGNDTLVGKSGIDQLSGGSGNDLLFSFETANTAGDSLLDGGDGFDTLNLSIAQFAGFTSIDLGDSSGRFRNLEQLIFAGGSGGNSGIGGGADDTMSGGAGFDEFHGGGGNDFLTGNLVYGDAGNDRVEGEFGASATLYGGEGNDLIVAHGSAASTLDGGAGNDDVRGDFGADTLTGGEGNDRLDGGSGADTMTGGIGNDTYVIDSLSDVVTELAGEGVDTIVSLLASYTLGDTFENLTGSNSTNAPSQTLIGNSGNNVITGGFNNDYLIGGGGEDAMAGGFGDDSFYLDSSGDTVVEFAGGGIDIIYASISHQLAAGSEIEFLSAVSQSATTPLTLVGNEFGQFLYGNAGANYLDGGSGNDTLVGFGGDDSYVVDDVNDYVAEVAGGGSDIVYVRGSFSLGADQEVETLAALSQAGTAPIVIVGNNFNQIMFGNAGANYLDGGSGNDTLVGFGGDDSYLVDDVNDYVAEVAGGGNDIVYVRGSFSLGADQEVETLAALSQAGTAPIVIVGNGIDQRLFGNNGDNYLDGGGGTDILQGFSGNDTYVVDSLGDYVVEAAGQGNDVVYARSSYALVAGQEIEVLAAISSGGTAAIDLTGNALANQLYGNNGANVLNGGAGGDYLQGYGGADSFAFTTALGGGNVDAIADFVSGTDKVLLDDAVFTGLGLGALNANAFVTGSQAGDADDRIVYNSATGQLFFDADGNGAGAQVLFATLDGHPPLAASDFTVI